MCIFGNNLDVSKNQRMSLQFTIDDAFFLTVVSRLTLLPHTVLYVFLQEIRSLLF